MSDVGGGLVRTVAVLGGRRADAADAAKRRLPPEAEGPVRAAIAELLRGWEVDLLIASAACGADILGLLAADDVGVRTQIVLPFDVARFRAESVADRGGAWGEIYDRLVEAVAARGDLIVRLQPDAPDPFAANNAEVVDRALATGATRRLVVLVWDGRPSGEADATADLAERAAAAGFGRRDVAPLELLP